MQMFFLKKNFFLVAVKTYNGTVVSGKPATIRCEAVNLHYLISFNWTKDQKYLSEISDLKGRYIEHENYTLEITKASKYTVFSFGYSFVFFSLVIMSQFTEVIYC